MNGRLALTEAIWNKSAGHCWYCGTELIKFTRDMSDRFYEFGYMGTSIHTNSFVIDHLISKFTGGSDKLDNLVPCCWTCNCSKRTKTVEEFRFYMVRKVNNIPYFNKEQQEWLSDNGFYFSSYEPYEFYFEKMRLTP